MSASRSASSSASRSAAPSTDSLPVVLRYCRAVLWSFFGIRRRAGARAEIEGLSPLALIATAVVLAACFILILLTVANWAVATR